MEAYAVGPRICSSCVVAKWPSFRAAPRQTQPIGCDLARDLRWWKLRSSSKTQLGALSGGISVGRDVPAWKRTPVSRRCQDVKDVLAADESSPSSEGLATELPSVVEFITSGVVAGIAGITPARVLGQLAHWMHLGNKLSDFLNFNDDGLSEAEIIRLYQYYLPVFFWCTDQLSIHRSRFADGEPIPPIVVRI